MEVYKMNRTIVSLAIIKSHWDKSRSDFIDNFIPLVAGLLKENNYHEVDLDKFQVDFQDRYGLLIPINALITIFNRARKSKIVYREHGKIFAQKKNLHQYDLSSSAAKIERKFKHLTNQISDFGRKNYGIDESNEEIENALLTFLKEHDLDILFAAKDRSVLPEVKSKNKLKYLVSAFSIHVFENDPNLFQFLLDISVGHALSGAILYSELSSFSGKLKGLNIYIDTPLILSIMGLNGEYKKRSVKELIDILNEEKANLFILDVNRGEVDAILSDCHRWLDKGVYDLNKASRVLRYCHRNALTDSDVEQLIVSLDRFLEENNILPSTVPDYSETEYVIDEPQLEKVIYKTYQSIVEDFDKELTNSRGTITRDVAALSGIYRFRKGYKPKTIKDCKAIFITSNTALAFASRRFETERNGTTFTIPACLTDVFLGTVIWLQSPQKVEDINSKRFMADCYAAIQPSNALIDKYLSEIEKLKSEDKISNDDYYLLRSHRVSLNLMETKTMGDPDAIDATSTEEILDSIIKSIKAEEAERLTNEINTHKETKRKLTLQQEEIQNIEQKQECKANNIAIRIGRIIFVLAVAILAICLFATLFPEYFNIEGNLKIVLWALLGFVTLFNLSTGFNLWGMKDRIINLIKIKVLKWLRE